MPESFLGLSARDRGDALGVAVSRSGRPAHILEKDIWVVWTLRVLFESAFAEHLVFKGGTSLSKVYKAIRRFSEDIDVTYDIRAFAPELVKDAPEALPPTRSQEGKWSSRIRKKLLAWVSDAALPLFEAQLKGSGAPAKARAEGENLIIQYEPVVSGYGYVRPEVTVEFGARSTGEPADVQSVTCDAAPYVSEVLFPEASPRVMRIERTFWEKSTAIHVYCRQGKLKGERFARHWYDIVRLDLEGHAARALEDRDLAQAVARHKSWFFAENDAAGEIIDYGAAVSGDLQLVPAGEALALLAADYAKMTEDGVLLDDAEPFEGIIERCRALQERANALQKQNAAATHAAPG
jgi:hypothetical protein